jgi:hypothetical protein
MGWVAFHEQIIPPFGSLKPHALLSADNKATEAANNKERLSVRHDMNTASKLGPHTQTDRGTCPGVGL